VDTHFATSHYIGEHRCYGLRLKPYCLLHSLQLETLGSPLVTLASMPTASDLIIGAQICATHEILIDFSKHRWARLRHSVQTEHLAFLDYYDNCNNGPRLYTRNSSGYSNRGLRAPWQQIIVTALIMQTTITLDQAWTMPLGQALWYYHSISEQLSPHGSVIQTDDDILDEQAQLEYEASDLCRDRIAAVIEREQRMKAGTWPVDDRGCALPLDLDNLRPQL
jgi:hypothetical protein